MNLLIILAIPVFVSAVTFFVFRKKVMWQEMVMQIVGISLLLSMVAFGCSASKKHDTEILNGHVTGKESKHVSCSHSYKCFCYTTTECSGSGKDRRCRQVEKCRTCYEHNYDVSWYVHATLGMMDTTFTVSRVDRQGLKEPQRWTQFQSGDPYMMPHSYDNYIKANAETLYKTQGYIEKFKSLIPAYPNSPSDYNTVLNRFLQVGTNFPDAVEWSKDITTLNKQIGSKRQCNILVITTHNQPEDYYRAIEEAWIGGKKNDVIVMIDSDPAGNIRWVNTLCWAKSDLFRVKLRDDILTIGKMDRVKIMEAIGVNVETGFFRKRMREFKYLDKAIILTNNEFMWLCIVALLLSIGVSVFVVMNDINDEEGGNTRPRWQY